MKALFVLLFLMTSNLMAAPDYIVVIASVKVKSGSQEKFKEAAQQVIAPTLKEQGAIAYEFNQSVEDPTEFSTYERWSKKENLDSHLKTEHMTRFFKIVGPLFERAPIIKIFKSIDVDSCVNRMKDFVQERNKWLDSFPGDDVVTHYTGRYTYSKVSDSIYEFGFEVNIHDIGNNTDELQTWKHQFLIGSNGTCKLIGE